MTTTTRRKAKRYLLSALISGFFSDREISEISEALINRDEFFSDLGNTLQQINSQLSADNPPKAQNDADEPRQSNQAREIVRLLKAQGIDKHELLGIIDEIAPGVLKPLVGKRVSTAGVIDLFLNSQTAEKARQLALYLRGRSPGKPLKRDPYLDLISRPLDEE